LLQFFIIGIQKSPYLSAKIEIEKEVIFV